jgi:hypothetical protein
MLQNLTWYDFHPIMVYRPGSLLRSANWLPSVGEIFDSQENSLNRILLFEKPKLRSLVNILFRISPKIKNKITSYQIFEAMIPGKKNSQNFHRP